METSTGENRRQHKHSLQQYVGGATCCVFLAMHVLVLRSIRYVDSKDPSTSLSLLILVQYIIYSVAFELGDRSRPKIAFRGKLFFPFSSLRFIFNVIHAYIMKIDGGWQHSHVYKKNMSPRFCRCLRFCHHKAQEDTFIWTTPHSVLYR